MKYCTVELMDFIIEQMCEAPAGTPPIGVAEQYIINWFINFKKEEHTPQEKYDFINSIGQIAIIKQKIGWDKK